MLAQVEPVVGGEENVGPAELPRILQDIHERRQQVVDSQQGAQPHAVLLIDAGDLLGAEQRQVLHPGRFVADVGFIKGGRSRGGRVGEGVGVPPRRRGRGVRRVGGQINEERRPVPRGAPDDVRRLSRQDVGQVVLRRVPILDQPAVFVHPVVVVAVRAARDRAVPLVPPGRHVGRIVPVRIAVQVLPHQRGPVSRGLEPGGDRGLVVADRLELLEAAARRRIGQDLVVAHVLTAEDGTARRAAQGVGHEEVGERRPLIRDQSLQLRHDRDRLRIQVIGENEDDVGAVGSGRGGRGAGESQHGGPQGQADEQDKKPVGPNEGGCADPER
ncbi:MAG: hypothetical protein XU14_C0014G0043 [Armatimonadetes bacterium CSP1-3]|nr:MAG: hypothetical protein XU14_C0014G0043 [Armatimonadetes bacterium CSP1-3]